MTTPASGSSLARLNEMSPVPGGMSTTNTSGWSQNTSVANCSSILCSIGPRQMTGALSSVSSPTDMTRTPCASSGTSSPSMMMGPRSMPIIRGIEKPHTSASIRATRRPRRAMATARLAAIDDLPTPPFPEAIATIRVCPNTVAGSVRSPCNRRRNRLRSRSFIAVRSTTTSATPRARTADATSCRMR